MQEKTVLQRKRVDKLFNFRPFLFSAVFFALGVTFSLYHHFRGVSMAWVLCVLPCAALPVFFCIDLKQWIKMGYTLLLLCTCFLMGFFSFFAQVNRYRNAESKESCYISGRVVEIRNTLDKVGLVLTGVSIDGEESNCRLIAYMPASFCEDLQLSDRVLLYGDVEKIDVNADGFSRQAEDFGKGAVLISNNPTGQKTEHVFDLFLALNARARKVIDAGMDETPAAVTRGVLLGDTSGMEYGLYQNIRYGGIAHIFAVSGLHVGSLFGFCLLLTKKTGLKRAPAWVQFLLAAGVLFLYAGICAFTPSVLRASEMCLVGYACWLLQIKTDFLETLGISATVIMLFNPSSLFTVGFQLSYAACFGIAFLSKPIGQVFDECAKLYRKFFPKQLTEAEKEALKNKDTSPPRISTRIYRNVSSFLSVSLAAQIFTSPLLLYYFGYVSGWALLLNCIFVPFISTVFSLLLVTVVLACIFPLLCATTILYVPNVLWSFVLLLFEMVDFSSFAIRGLQISISSVLLYLLATLFFTDKWNIGRRVSLLLGVVCFCAFAIGMVALNV